MALPCHPAGVTRRAVPELVFSFDDFVTDATVSVRLACRFTAVAPAPTDGGGGFALGCSTRLRHLRCRPREPLCSHARCRRGTWEQAGHVGGFEHATRAMRCEVRYREGISTQTNSRIRAAAAAGGGEPSQRAYLQVAPSVRSFLRDCRSPCPRGRLLCGTHSSLVLHCVHR